MHGHSLVQTAGRKINVFSGSHLAPKYFKLVANSKKLVAIMTHTKKCDARKIRTNYKEYTRMGHIQLERLPKSMMASSDDRFMFEIVHVLRFGNELNE